ncbi:MAG: nucleoside/nucleotide kinase family protein [Kineosporiaceae bacterium]
MRSDAPRLTADEAVARARLLADAATPFRRVLLGVTGPPGAGKSTLAAAVARALGPDVVAVVPMDGFHLADGLLHALGRHDRKGAPDTFDAEGYADLLDRLRDRTRESFAPLFDRDRELAEVGAQRVAPGVPLVVTEGNYLLLADGPWRQVAGLLDECWYVDVDDEVRRRRLMARHEAHGRPAGEARARTLGSDEANALYVGRTRGAADAVVAPG